MKKLKHKAPAETKAKEKKRDEEWTQAKKKWGKAKAKKAKKAKAKAKANLAKTRILEEDEAQKAVRYREDQRAAALEGKKKKQKIALCFFGMPPMKCNKRVKVLKDLSFKCWKENVIDINGADVFIHAWGKNDEESLVEKYKPVDYILEDNIVFDEDHFYKYDYGCTTINMFYSQAYSAQKSINLKAKHEKENGFVYDLVMMSRIDCLWLRPIDLSMLDNQYFYISNWNQQRSKGARLAKKSNITTVRREFRKVLDYWFISNSKNIDEFSNLFHYLPQWLKEYEGNWKGTHERALRPATEEKEEWSKAKKKWGKKKAKQLDKKAAVDQAHEEHTAKQLDKEADERAAKKKKKKGKKKKKKGKSGRSPAEKRAREKKAAKRAYKPSNHTLKKDFLVEIGLWDKVKFEYYEHHDHNLQRYFYAYRDYKKAIFRDIVSDSNGF